MVEYKFKIEGIHCSGCISLIKMSLEEEALEVTSIDKERNSAKIITDLDEKELVKILDKVFNELQQYKYFDLEKEN